MQLEQYITDSDMNLAPRMQIRACLAEHRMSVHDHGGLDAMMTDIANQTEPVIVFPSG